MLNGISEALDFQAAALDLRAERQKALAANIANADTPGYKALDFDFGKVMRNVAAGMPVSGGMALAQTSAGHLGGAGAAGTAAGAMQYRQPSQAAVDSNTVDLDLERAQFADNAVRYEATLRFINNQVKALQTAMQSPTGS